MGALGGTFKRCVASSIYWLRLQRTQFAVDCPYGALFLLFTNVSFAGPTEEETRHENYRFE